MVASNVYLVPNPYPSPLQNPGYAAGQTEKKKKIGDPGYYSTVLYFYYHSFICVSIHRESLNDSLTESYNGVGGG